MASSPHITAGPTTALNTTGGITSSTPVLSTHNSTGNINTHTPSTSQANMRLNFSLVGSNPHAFSTSSLYSGTNNAAVGFISPMVPPSPRSPVSTARSGSIARPTSRPYRTPSALMLNSLSPASATNHSAMNNLNTSLSAALAAAAASSSATTANTIHGSIDTKALRPPYIRKGPSPFFGSGHSLPSSSAYMQHGHGIADPTAEAESTEQHGQVIEAPLRTQEIMLFYLSTLLKALAMDSYKVRVYLMRYSIPVYTVNTSRLYLFCIFILFHSKYLFIYIYILLSL